VQPCRLGGAGSICDGIIQDVAGGGEQDTDGQADSALSIRKMDPNSP
jgi:hypothetical protein